MKFRTKQISIAVGGAMAFTLWVLTSNLDGQPGYDGAILIFMPSISSLSDKPWLTVHQS